MMNIIGIFLVSASVLVGVGATANAYINGPYTAAPVTAGRLCGELAQAGISAGAQREGHVLRSVSCGGSGHSFTVHLTID